MDSNTTRAALRARQQAHRSAFDSTVEAYRSIQFLHPVQAMRLDPTAPQSRSLGPGVVEYKVDVEAAVTFALDTAPELLPTFIALVNEEPVDAVSAHQVIQRCGRVFASRRLTPARYFAPRIRTGRAVRTA